MTNIENITGFLDGQQERREQADADGLRAAAFGAGVYALLRANSMRRAQKRAAEQRRAEILYMWEHMEEEAMKACQRYMDQGFSPEVAFAQVSGELTEWAAANPDPRRA